MEYKDYTTTLENLQKTLDTYGVAVIPNILNNIELTEMEKGMWTTLGQLTKEFDKPIKKEDSKSWSSFYDLMPLHSMLLQYHQVGHAQFVWNIRQNPKVVNVFCKLWNCKPEELLSSFDGVSIHFPPEVTGRGYYKNHDWLHTDQSYTRNDFECIQSFVSCFDINEGDATLTLLEGSHKYHKQFADTLETKSTSDWYKLTDEEYKFYTNLGCKRTFVKCPAGSMVLWDSRTIHSGAESMKNRKKQNTRLVVYVCQTPRKLCDSNNLEKKKSAFNNMRMTSHWPHKIKLFPTVPRTYGKVLPTIKKLPKPVLTKLGNSLAGL